MEKNRWFYIAMGGVIIAIVSLFLPIITYVVDGTTYTFNIIDFVSLNPKVDTVLAAGYQGIAAVEINASLAGLLGLLTAVSILCAVIGLITLRAQRPNTMQFVLTIVGLIGVTIPSATAIVLVLVYGANYVGTLMLGVAPILTPIAMVFSIAAVFRRKNRVAEEMQRDLVARGYIRRGGDL